MASFIPSSLYFRQEFVDGIWMKDRFDNFVNEFDIKFAMYTSAYFITDSSVYLNRFLTTVGRKPTKRKEEMYYFGGQYNLDQYAHLFDHPTAIKTSKGYHLIVSMPYGTKEQIIKEFEDMQKNHPCTRSIDLYFIDQKHKFRTNGDYMVLFVCWPIGKRIEALKGKTNYHWRRC